MKTTHDGASSSDDGGPNPMDKLLAKLSEQQDALSKQRELLRSTEEQTVYALTVESVSGTSNSTIVTPALDNLNSSMAPTTHTPSPGKKEAPPSAEEVLRLKLELEAAKGKLARMDQELAQSRITKHSLDQVIGTLSELDYPVDQQTDESDLHLNNLQQSFKPDVRFQSHRDRSWATGDDSRSDTSDCLSASGFNRTRAIWGNGLKPSFSGAQPSVMSFQSSDALAANQWVNRGFGQPFLDAPMQFTGAASVNNLRGDRMMPDSDLLMASSTNRRNNLGGRFNNRAVGSFSYASSSGSFEGFTPVSSSFGAGGVGTVVGTTLSLGMPGLTSGMYSGYQPQPIGTPLSPHAAEFTSSTGWKGDVSDS